MSSTLNQTFRWRKSEDEVPIYGAFGSSNEVVGIDAFRNRGIYTYSRGEWFLSTSYSSPKQTPPIYWHYLPRRLIFTEEEKEQIKQDLIDDR